MKNNTNSTKKIQKRIILMLVIIALAILGFFAFSKYITEITGNGEAEIARWKFKVTNGTQEGTEKIQFEITRTDDNKTVDPETIAPGTSGEFRIIIDTTGTEVALKYDIAIDLYDCPKNLIFYKVTDSTEDFDNTEKEDPRPKEPISKFEDKLLISRYLPLEKASRSIYRNHILGMALPNRNNTSTKRYK